LEKISDRLRKCRKSISYTQKMMCDELNITEQSVNKYEKGKRTPSVETLVRWAQITKCDPGWLLTGEDKETIFRYSNKNFEGTLDHEGDTMPNELEGLLIEIGRMHLKIQQLEDFISENLDVKEQKKNGEVESEATG